MKLNYRLVFMLSTFACLVLSFATNANAAFILALTQSNQLISFDSATPGTTSTPVSISGLTSGDTLFSIDVRPSNGLLYGFAGNGTVGRVYSIDSMSGVATLSATLNQALSGMSFTADFNPVADRLRVISDTGQNLRVNLAGGLTTVDTALQYAAGDANAGNAPTVVAAAYTNSIGTPLTTTLYDIDSSIQTLVIQNPPNNGTLNTVANLGGIAVPETTLNIDGLAIRLILF